MGALKRSHPVQYTVGKIQNNFHGFCSLQYIRKTCPCYVYPLEPHFYIAKLGYAGVYLFFLIFAPKHRLWVLDCVPTIYVLSKNKKNVKQFLLKIFIFCNLKNHCSLHGQVFVMTYLDLHQVSPFV